MKRHVFLTLLLTGGLLFGAIGPAAADGVPPDVAERLEAAGMLGQSEGFVGSFTLTTDTVIQKTNGKGRREATMVVAVSRSPDGTVDRRLVQMVEDGEDVTEKRRKKLEKSLAEDAAREDDGDDDDDLVEPLGDAADKYSFGAPRIDGDAVLLSFEPKSKNRDEEGMAQGVISWHRETLDPLWMEMEAVTAPSPMKELSLRMEFAREGDAVYVDRLVTEGVAKVLLFTRQFEMILRISEVEAIPSETPAVR